MSNKFTINMMQPGSALQDFHSLLDFIGADGELVSMKTMVFSAKDLLELNSRMTNPIKQDQKRPQQSGFPHISILYHCAKWLGFFHYTEEGTRKRVHLNPAALASWDKLNFTEQYFTLLESWLCGDPNARAFSVPMIRLDWFKRECLCKREIEYEFMQRKGYRVGDYAAGLDLFGLVEIQHANPDAGGGWKIATLNLTQTGEFVFDLMGVGNPGTRTFDPFFYMGRKDEGNAFYKLFQPHFPELKNLYSLEQEESERPGVYLFKVSLGSAWRRIAIDHEATLEDLAEVLLYAFSFDNDHLYVFRFDDTSGCRREYMCPRGSEAEAFVDEVCIGELPLSVKASMKFIFDFGDRWEFKVLLEKVDPDGEVDVADITEESGEAPKQYPDYDDEW
jgi:hypothetical protein